MVRQKIEFYKHNIDQKDINKVVEVLNSLFITTGKTTEEFEHLFADYLKVKYCVGVSSWTNGAFLVLKAWNIGAGDEVIVPPMTFIASANVVLHCGAKPVFVDVEAETGLIDIQKIEAAITPKTKAIIPVHLYGQMADIKAIKEIANKYNLKILEDAAHCIEGDRDDIKPGQLGDAAVFSFYATKNITSGEGGAIVSNDETLANKLKILRLHGMDKSAATRYTDKYRHWDMEMLGYKANMFDIQAALLINQVTHIEEMWKRRNEIANIYEEAFRGKIDFPETLLNLKHARHLFTIWVDANKRDALIASLEDSKIGVAVNYRAIHLLKYYRENFGYREGYFPVAEKIGARTISIPLYPKLTEQEIEYLIDTIKKTVSTQ